MADDAPTGSLFGLDAVAPAPLWTSAPLTPESLREAFERYQERMRNPPPPEPFLVNHWTWERMEAVRREFPKATEWQALHAAWGAESDEDAIAAFRELFLSEARSAG